MKDSISVINSGSSSIKFSLYAVSETQSLEPVFHGQVDGIGVAPRFKAKDPAGNTLEERHWPDVPDADHDHMMAFIISWIKENRLERGLSLRGVGHRVVHGGNAYSAPVIVDETVIQQLETYSPLAPLHQPHNLLPIRAVARMYPELPQVACFDTAFHYTISQSHQAFALPRWLIDEGVRRYGFHGLSYEYIAGRLPWVDPKAATGRTVVAHLGSGASMCAMLAGKSVASTMGFSGLDGLPMGTRTGALDPGVLLYLMQEKRMDVQAIEDLLYRRSGLLGISGISNDMRVLLESDDEKAREAITVFVNRIQRELGGLVAILGGLDALVFTAGIGENAAEVRARILKQTEEWLGLEWCPDANRAGGPRLSTEKSPVAAWVIPTNEELMIATHAKDLLLNASRN